MADLKNIDIQDLKSSSSVIDKKTYQRIVWKTMDLLRDHVAQQGMPLDVFRNYTLSFDNGNTVQYFGSGVVRVLDILRKQNNIEAPIIDWTTFQVIVRSNDLIHNENSPVVSMTKKMYKKGGGSWDKQVVAPEMPRQMMFRDQIMFNTAEEKEKFNEIVYVDKGIRSFNGAICNYTHNGEKSRICYALPDISYDKTQETSPLFSNPISFLKRKMKNDIYKRVFSDLGVDVEVTEERGADPFYVVGDTTEKREDLSSKMGEFMESLE